MRLSLFAFLFALTVPVCAEDSKIAALFAQAGVDGTLIIASVASSERTAHNEVRAAKPFIPASTFKVLNTLIAGPESPISRDGTEYEIAATHRAGPRLAGAR